MIKLRIYLVKLGFFALILAVPFSSCKKENGPWWDADFSGPIAKTSLNINNLLPDSILVSNPDSSLKISYSANIFNYAVDSLLSIPDTTLDTSYVWLFNPVAINPGQTLFTTLPSENYFNVNNVSLIYAILKTGIIKVELGNSITQPVVFNYTLLKSDFGGSNFAINEKVPAGSIANPSTITKYYPIDGIKLDLTGILGDKFNAITTTSSVSIDSSASNDSIFPNEKVSVKITFMKNIPLYAKGYMGNQVVAVGLDTFSFNFLGGLKADYFALQNATVNLKLTNGFGVDMSAGNFQISSINSANSTTVPLTGLAANYNLNRAVYTGNNPNPVTPQVKNIPLNTGNSGIKAFIENLPDKISYQTNAQLNPLGNVSGNNDFVYYGYGFSADMDIDIPLAFSATNLRFSDTTNFDISALTQADNINHGQLVLRADNGYPFDARIQAYVLDANKNIVDSLFATPNTAAAGNVDASFKVTSKKLSLLYIPLDHQKIEKLKTGKKIVFKVVMNTVSQPQIVKIYDYYTMGLVLTADINYSVNKK